MENTLGKYIFGGLLFGAVFGLLFGPALGNPLITVGAGALTGVFLGWFIGAAVIEREKSRREQ